MSSSRFASRHSYAQPFRCCALLFRLSGWLGLLTLGCMYGRQIPQDKAYVSPRGPVHFTVQYVFSFGHPGGSPGGFSHPYGISVDTRGYIYIADTGNDRVQKFDHAGRFLAQVGGFGWDREQFNRPVDVCARADLDIYVADSQNRRIQRFDEQLNLVATLEAPLDQGAEWGYLSSVATSQYGDLYVADDENDRIFKIDPFGRLDRTFGGLGNVSGELSDPCGLVVAEDGTIYVCDSGNSRIVQLDAFGDILDAFGQEVLAAPSGIDIGPAQYLFVTDTERHQVFVFDRRHRLVQKIGIEGSGPGSFSAPYDVAIDPRGYLYVLDSGNARVQKFRIEMVQPGP